MAKKPKEVLRTKGVVIDLARLSSDLELIEAAVKAALISETRKSLEAQIDAIQRSTANRATESGLTSPGTQDNPLEGAKVTAKQLRGLIIKDDAFTSRRAGSFGVSPALFVQHEVKGSANKANLFNILDEGTKNRVASSKFVFPAYDTPILTSSARNLAGKATLGNPDAIGNIFRTRTKLRTRTRKIKTGRRAGTQVTEIAFASIRQGQIYGGSEGLELYKAAASYVQSILNDSNFTVNVRGQRVVVNNTNLLVRVKSTRGIKPE